MRIVIAGPGRAGMSIALAAHREGAEIVGILARRDASEQARAVEAKVLEWDAPLPGADLVLLAVRDDAIEEVARRVVGLTPAPLVHLSGLAGLEALAPAAHRGSFHPLQTLPDAASGAARLRGAPVAVAASDDQVRHALLALATLLGMDPFEVRDGQRPLYHAAAAASANFVVTVLAMAHRLYEAAGVDPAVARRLTETVVENVFDLGPEAALTGPVARGDVGTVAAHLQAVAHSAPQELAGFRALVTETARIAGTVELFEELLA